MYAVMVEDVHAETLARIAAGADTTLAKAQHDLDEWLNAPPLPEATGPKARYLRLMGVA